MVMDCCRSSVWEEKPVEKPALFDNKRVYLTDEIRNAKEVNAANE
jgi:hypothetical protein